MVITYLAKGDHSTRAPRAAAVLRPAVGVPAHGAARRGRQAGAASGEPGEICVAGPLLAGGYWNLPDETAETFRDGWMHTGDVAREDEDGFWYIVDRTKDMIVTGGFNVFPREVEDVVAEHPAVAQVGVIGVPDEKLGRGGHRDRRTPRGSGADRRRGRRDPGCGQGAQGRGAVAQAGDRDRRAAADRRSASPTRRRCARSSGTTSSAASADGVVSPGDARWRGQARAITSTAPSRPARVADTLLPMRARNGAPKMVIGDIGPSGGGPSGRLGPVLDLHHGEARGGQVGGVLADGLHERRTPILGPRHRVGERAVARAHLVEDREPSAGFQHPVDLGEQRQLVGDVHAHVHHECGVERPVAKGRVSPGVATNEAVSLRPTRSVRVVAASTNSGVRSTPVTWASYVAASRDGPPMPQPTSSSRVARADLQALDRVPGRGRCRRRGAGRPGTGRRP